MAFRKNDSPLYFKAAQDAVHLEQSGQANTMTLRAHGHRQTGWRAIAITVSGVRTAPIFA